MIIKNDFPCKNCPKKGCGAYHDVCEAYRAFKQEQATNKSEDAKTRFVANHAPYRVRHREIKNRRTTMKTEQEQIEQIEKVLKDSVADYKHLKKKGVCYCYAETLIDHGYGDVSEYKAEIERLRTTLGQCNAELNSALESLKSQCREIGELKAGVKQAQIDVLNRVMTYINNKIENDYGDMSDSVKYLTVDIDDFDDFIDELIEEIEK